MTAARALVWAMVVTLSLGLQACAVPPAVAISSEERERYAAEAGWAPGQLEAHFQRHPEGYGSVPQYDRGARETILNGTAFTYRDRTTGAQRLGFYEPESNRFTALTDDGRRITTHFQPDRGENYLRRLPESTYR